MRAVATTENRRETDWRSVEATVGAHHTHCEMYHCQPGAAAGFPRHAHEEYQLYLNHDLAYRYDYRGERFVAPPNVLCIFHPGEAHEGRDVAQREAPSRFRVLYIGADLLQEGVGNLPGAKPFSPAANPLTDDNSLSHLFIQAHEMLRTETVTRFEEDTALMRLFHRLMRLAAPESLFLTQDAEIRRESQRHAAVQRARAFLHDHHARNITLSELVEECHLSGHYLHHAFRKQFGLPPHAYLLNVRIGRAKSYLLRGVPVQQVAQEVGFADQSHFTRCFRRLVGVTPKQYAARPPLDKFSQKSHFVLYLPPPGTVSFV